MTMIHRNRLRVVFVTIAAAVMGVWLWTRFSSRQEVPLPDLTDAEPAVYQRVSRAHAETQARRGSASAWGYYGMVLQAHGFVAEADHAYRHAHVFDRTDFRWPYFLGVLWESTEPTQAEQWYRVAEGLDDEYAPLHVRLGRMLHRLDRDDEAMQYFHRALRVEARTAAAHHGLGQILLRRGETKEALSALEQAARLEPRNTAILATLARAYRRADQTEQASRLARAIASLPGDGGYLHDPRYFSVQQETVTIEGCLNRSEAYRAAGRLNVALTELQKALESSPENPYIHAAAARLYGQLGRYADAVKAARTAKRLLPDVPGIDTVLALALTSLGEYDEAEPHLRIAAEENPHDAEMQRMIGTLYLQREQFEEAIGAFEQALRVVPGWSPAVRGLADAQSRAGRSREAAATLRAALEMRPDDWTLANNLAWLLATSSDAAVRDGAEATRLAEEITAESIRRQPSTLDTLAAAYAEAGRFEDAVRTMEEALDLMLPGGEDALSASSAADGADRVLGEYRRRLDLYRARQPYRTE